MNDLINLEKMIYVIRGQNVMLDSDLAALYGVETRTFNQAIKRNLNRLPSDFMFQLSEVEWDSLRSQFVISKEGRGGRRYCPFVFTENGVAMLSGILNSDRAIAVNIAIMRTFTKLRSFLMMGQDLHERMNKLEEGTTQMFRIVFERMDSYEEILTPALDKERRKIGIK